MQQQNHMVSPATGAVPATSHEHELPGLAGIANIIRWFESLIMLLSGPVLTIGLGIAIVGLMTNDKVLNEVPALLYIWAISQAVGIDSQLVAAWDRVRIAGRNHDWFALIGYLILGCALGYIGFLSAAAFGFQNAFAVTEAQALARLGIDPNNWQLQRAIVSVALVALSGLLRYHPPVKNTAGKTAEEKERLQAELQLEPLRAQLRNQKVRDLRAAALTAVGRDTPQPAPTISSGKPAIHAAATLPDVEPQTHYSAHSAQSMHDWDEIPDELEEGSDLYSTMEIPTPSRPLVDSTPVASSGGRRRINAGLTDGMGNDFPLDGDEDDADYPSHSAHQRKKGKSSSGHRNQRQYKAQRATEVQATRERGRAIDLATDAVFAEMLETGDDPSDYDLVERVNDHLERMGSSVRTSRTAVRRRKADWLAQMGLNSAMDRTERQLQEVGGW